jgi:hypothetical protein
MRFKQIRKDIDFSADNFSVYMYNFIDFDSMKFMLNYIYYQQIPTKNQKIVLGITLFPNENNTIAID